MRRAVALALAAACGSSPSTTDAPIADAAPIDAFAIVTGRDVVDEIRNDEQHLPITDTRMWGSIAVTLRQPDGTWAPVDVAADGSFAFAMPDARTYRLAFEHDGATIPTELQLAVPHLELAGRAGFRYDRTPAPAGTTLAVTLGNAPGTGTAQIEPTGVWTNLPRTTPSNASFSIDWTQAPGLLDAGAHDRAYATIIDNVGAAPQVPTIVSACSADVTMTGGASTPMTCTLAPVALDHCMHVHARVATEFARLTAATPSTIAYPNPAYSWLIYAVPVLALGPTGLLQIAGVGANTPPASDYDRDQTMFGVPFPGHAPILAMVVQRYRAVVLPGTTSGPNFSLITQHFVTAQPDCSRATDASGTVAIAGVPTLADMPLATDNTHVTIDRSGDVKLAWPIAEDGRADYWQVNLFALSVQGSATVATLQRRWVVSDAHVALDPALLVAGTPYILQVLAIQGFPNAGDGDFRTIAFPFAISTQPSAIFEVSN